MKQKKLNCSYNPSNCHHLPPSLDPTTYVTAITSAKTATPLYHHHQPPRRHHHQHRRRLHDPTWMRTATSNSTRLVTTITGYPHHLTSSVVWSLCWWHLFAAKLSSLSQPRFELSGELQLVQARYQLMDSFSNLPWQLKSSRSSRTRASRPNSSRILVETQSTSTRMDMLRVASYFRDDFELESYHF